MRTSQLVDSVAESATMRINERAGKLKAAGKPVVHLGVGQPLNKAPDDAVRAAESRLRDGRLKYTPAAGTPSLRQTIARYESDSYGASIAPENVIVCNGSKHALYNLLTAILDPGDEIVYPAPYWVTYPEMVKLVRGTAVAVPPPAGTLRPDLDAVLAAIGERTRAVMLNSPNNPSGQVYPAAFIEELVHTCETRGVYLIMDDIYRLLVFDGPPAPSAYQFTDREIESSHVIVVNGVSKVYGMTGLRLGWAIGPTPLIRAMNKIQGQTTSNASVLSQSAAEGALNGDQSGVAELIGYLRGNRDAMLEGLAGIHGLHYEQPGGGLYCFPDFSSFESDSLRLAELLLEKALVATVPGVPFGAEGHLRLGFAGDRQDVVEGVRRIQWALDPAAEPELEVGEMRLVRDWN